jgi:hypothetical protein
MTADIRELVPRHKRVDRARAAVEAGYPAVATILGELIEWLQDYNWPVAHVLEPFLRTIGEPLVPHIWHVLRSDDELWKYWVISLLITAARVGSSRISARARAPLLRADRARASRSARRASARRARGLRLDARVRARSLLNLASQANSMRRREMPPSRRR